MSETKTKLSPAPSPKERRRARGPKILLRDTGTEARRVAVAVLEVLAGARSPTEAAEALGVSAPRYYALESRALSGLVAGCRRRSRGPQRSAERECARLRREVERLGRECTRLQALVRLSQRTVGIARVAETPKKGPEGKRRRKRATVRALRALESLREANEEKTLATAGPPGDDRGVMSARPGGGVEPEVPKGP